MNKPDIFDPKKASPRIFSDAKTIHEAQKNMKEWLPLFDAYCSKMYDFGFTFLEEFKKTECEVIFDHDVYKDATNSLAWGNYDPCLNKIHFGEAGLCSKIDFLYTLFHEAIHAIQHKNCVSLYPGSVDPDVPHIVLSPSAFIRQKHIIERDATAKESIFAGLLDWIEEEGEIDFLEWSEEGENLGEHIREASGEALCETGPSDPDKELYSCLIDDVLEYYEEHLEWYKEEDSQNNLIFTSLGIDDIWHLGNSLNINSMYKSYDDVVLYEELRLDNQQRKRLNALNAALNIGESELPSFCDVFTENYADPEEYIKMIRDMYEDDEDS